MLDITFTDPFDSGLLDNAADKRGYGLDVAVSRKKEKYEETYPNSHKLLPLVISTCGHYSPEIHDIVKELNQLEARQG